MTGESVHHASFTVERSYPAAPAKVWFALSDPAAKKRWFADPANPMPDRHEMDFRVGGREVNAGGPKGGPVHTFSAIYMDIVPGRRIVYAYDMHVGESRISVSLATIEIEPEGAGTRLILTEQAVFLDGFDDGGGRDRGTRELLDALGTALSG